jgi:ribonuclease-3
VRFRRMELLREAMTHASWNNERGVSSRPGLDNERLEYLGDAVLELVVGEFLFKKFPDYDEGKLTQQRAALVNTMSLARLAERLGLGDTLLVGRGAEKTGARQLPSLLANSFEALIGAIFLDQGYRVATRVFIQNIGDLADWGDENFKGKLQEVAQERRGTTPTYRVVASTGPGHRRQYTAEAQLDGLVVGSGNGNTKQAAEQAAARDALNRLDEPTAAASAAGAAAKDASERTASEPPRVRRRVAEVAAERRTRTRKRSVPAPAAAGNEIPAGGRWGILRALKAAAESIVKRPAEEPEPPPPPPARRRGRRGGRGRRRPGTTTGGDSRE